MQERKRRVEEWIEKRKTHSALLYSLFTLCSVPVFDLSLAIERSEAKEERKERCRRECTLKPRETRRGPTSIQEQVTGQRIQKYKITNISFLPFFLLLFTLFLFFFFWS